jgi:TRAP-type C4-dicarboxylate transport system permease small subunit
MFGMSIGKLLVLAALILVVWYGFKYAARVEAVRQKLRAEALARRTGGAGTRSSV